MKRFIWLLRKFDAALVVACLMLAVVASSALAAEFLFLSQWEPPGKGNNNGKQTYTGHVWGWAGGGAACIHEYIPSVNTWTSPHCSVEYEEGVNDYPETIAKPGAWNDPNQFYGEHFTQGKQWYV